MVFPLSYVMLVISVCFVFFLIRLIRRFFVFNLFLNFMDFILKEQLLISSIFSIFCKCEFCFLASGVFLLLAAFHGAVFGRLWGIESV